MRRGRNCECVPARLGRWGDDTPHADVLIMNGDDWRRALQTHHISVCICTFKRLKLLRQLLDRLEDQRTDELFTYSLVVADNNSAQSPRQVVADSSPTPTVCLTYSLRSHQIIAW